MDIYKKLTEDLQKEFDYRFIVVHSRDDIKLDDNFSLEDLEKIVARIKAVVEQDQ